MRAAIAGGLVLALLALVAVLAGGSEDPGAPVGPSGGGSGDDLVLVDADAHGSVYTRGALMIGADADGHVRWKLHLGKDDLLPFAVCQEHCPEAMVTIGRSGTSPPDRPDSARMTIGAPSWNPVEAAPRLRIDRPLFGGTVPLRLAVADADAQPALLLGPNRSVAVDGVDYAPDLAADRRTGVLVGPRNAKRTSVLVLRRVADGWALRKRVPLADPVGTVCVSPDGGRIGLVGGGPPRLVDVAEPGAAHAHVLSKARPIESEAGDCAIASGTTATAVIRSAGEGTDNLLAIHAGRRVHRLRLKGEFIAGLWVSQRTGTTAVLHERKLLLIAPNGRRRVIDGVAAATAGGPSRLRLIDAQGRMRTEAY
jgi:hypothetical protein